MIVGIVCDLYLDGDLQIYKTYQYPPQMYFFTLRLIKKKICRQNLIVRWRRRDKYPILSDQSINLFGELQNLGKWNNRTQKTEPPSPPRYNDVFDLRTFPPPSGRPQTIAKLLLGNQGGEVYAAAGRTAPGT